MGGGDRKAADRERPLVDRVVDAIPAMLAYWDSALRCRFANRAYERWFGVSPEALVGKHISELLGPLYELNLPYIQGALRGSPQEFEREIPDPAGGPARHSLATYIPDQVGGVVQGFFVHVADISERKRAEIALRESEERFSGIISLSADAIISIDEGQRITIFNEGAEEIFGYAKAEVLGTPLDRLIPTRFRTRHRTDVETFAAGQSTTRQISDRGRAIFGLRKNGEEFPAEAAISKLEVGGKKLLTVALRDITERKRVEVEREVLAEAGAVLASSLNYKQTLKGIATVLVPRVADFCAVDIIEGAGSTRLALTPADPEKAALCERLAALPLDRRRLISWPAIETKQTQVLSELTAETLDTMAQTPEHRDLVRALGPRSAVVAPMFSGSGVFGALILVSTTPGRYRARDAGLATELARRAALAIENAHLYEKAQRATQARDDMLAVVAHDVRAPLSAIGLAAAAIAHGIGSERDRRSVAVIERSVERANRLIQDLLDTTRIEAGALSVELNELSAAEVLSDAAEVGRPLATGASLELRLDVAAELPRISADRTRLLQVFENLVGNAVRYTPPGGRITLGASAKPGEALFWVADTGAGIAAEDLPRVFDRFWKAKGSAQQSGAGLGLAICKGIVEAHAGRLWVESVPGRGTTFSFTIPIRPSGRAGAASPS
jgi:PAS domain S-box-containing protein